MLVFSEIAVEDKREGTSPRCPALIRICNRQIDRGAVVVFCPGVTRDLLASQQIMFDARENAAPVTTVKSLINNSIDLYINSVSTE
jgi:hypothetical protein